MDANHVIHFLEMVGATRIKIGNGWVHACCPLAPWTHQKGSDSRPSFGVSIDEGLSSFKCLGCGRHGDLRALAWRIQISSKKSMWKVLRFLDKHDFPSDDPEARAKFEAGKAKLEEAQMRTIWGVPKVEIAGVRVPVTGSVPFALAVQAAEGSADPGVPEEEYEALPKEFPSAIWHWLTDPRPPMSERGGMESPPRGLLPDTVSLFGLRWDPEKKKVVIPVRDSQGKLVTLTRRATEKWQKPKFLHSKGFKRDLYLFGENLLAKKGGRVVIVEGHFDVMWLRQHGYPVLGVMGSHLAWMQIEKVRQLFQRATILRDGDQAGVEATAAWKQAFEANGVPCDTPDVPDGYDPDDHDGVSLWEMLRDP